MIIPDLIVSWPRNCDYPLWRNYIRTHRERFNEVIIVFTETHQGDDYRDFIKAAMFTEHVLFVDCPPIGANEDWRDKAIHAALLHSYNAQWLLFGEQDFFMHENFWEEVDASERLGVRAIGIKDADRLHPCALFLRRDLLTELDLNFGVVKDKLDHFGLIQKQLENTKEPIGILPPSCYEHLNGLSQNMTMIYNGESPNWNPQRLVLYLRECLTCGALLDPRFSHLIIGYLNRVETQ